MKRILIIWALLISVCFAQSKAGFYVVGGKIITVQDTSSRKYLKAIEDAGVVPSILQNFASNYLVTTEKAIGTWTLMKAQYPFIGGTAGTHKFNLNDPRDLDVAFRLAFTGGITHSILGAKGDGFSGFAETFLVPSTTLTVNSTHMSIYSSGGFNNANGIDLRAVSSSTSDDMILNTSRTNGATVSAMYDQSSGLVSTTTPNTSKYIIGNRRSSSSHKIFMNGQEMASNTTNAGALPSIQFYAFASKPFGSPVDRFSLIRMGYLSIGSSFTDTQAIQQSQIVTSFEGFLGRQ